MVQEGGTGPLAGVKVVEIAGIGAAPFGVMMLADMGAEVTRVDRILAPGESLPRDPRVDVLNRGRRSIAINLKEREGSALVRSLTREADVFVEAFRPGVAERLGLGPDELMAANPRLVYARMTGWGQEGPLAQRAGHDINFISATGALHAIGDGEGPPLPPLNVLGDFGGGGMYLAFGIVCALLEAKRSGKGQVVDAAMVDGAASLMAIFYALQGQGLWRDRRGSNRLDGGAPHYRCYETSDGKYVAVGALEPKFFAALAEGLGFDPAGIPSPDDRDRWPSLRDMLAERFLTRTRDEWVVHFAETDACVTPVLSIAESMEDRHLTARSTFTTRDGIGQPSPSPRLSRTPGAIGNHPPKPGQQSADILAEIGLERNRIDDLIKRRVIAAGFA